MIDVTTFLDLTETDNSNQVPVKFGTIPPNYTSGRPRVIIDGNTAATVKAYPYLSSYTPAANHRVIIVKGVILGRII
ncbi:hypothetical protein PBC1_020 [Bacillus phage PBC1]|uniref:Uncharacterized protein n=1 Tax=Bacillus phage PBC1 TaxID=1161901 RepID=I1TLF4_9CAUD|nr:hypothetical protein PBC1_gp20 [Bacillus phage PBC1]AFE86256.1 hypothetical protein PBC1_020 [Bacillus phage PBC1]